MAQYLLSPWTAQMIKNLPFAQTFYQTNLVSVKAQGAWCRTLCTNSAVTYSETKVER